VKKIKESRGREYEDNTLEERREGMNMNFALNLYCGL